MAAANTDKFMEVGNPGTATTLSAPGYTIGASGITVASTTNWPTTTAAAFAIDRVDSAGVQIPGSYNEFVGTVASGTSVANVVQTYGTPQNYAAGTTTRVYIPVSSTRENRLVQGMLVQHNQDGTHANVITTNAINENTSGNGVTIDGLNIKDNKLNTNDSVQPNNLLAGTGSNWAWTDYSATSTIVGWSSTTTKQFRYKQHGKTVYFAIVVAGTSNSGSISFTLPVPAHSGIAFWEGQVALAQDSGAITTGDPRWAIETGVNASLLSVFGSMAGGGWTPSGTKVVRLTGFYEAA